MTETPATADMTAAKDAAVRMKCGAGALLAGWFITFLLFCAGLLLPMLLLDQNGTGALGWSIIPIVLMYGFPPAALLGLPLGMLIAWPLRRVRNQWLHVAAFALGTGVVFWFVVWALSDKDDSSWSILIGLLAATCAAIGRTSVIKLVAGRTTPAPLAASTGPTTQATVT